MLLNLNKTPSPGDIVAIKLVSGDEIIAKLVQIEGSVFTLSRPVILMLTPTGGGQAQVSFGPFMLGVDIDNEFDIDLSQMLVYPIKARNDAAKQYLQSTTSIAL